MKISPEKTLKVIPGETPYFIRSNSNTLPAWQFWNMCIGKKDKKYFIRIFIASKSHLKLEGKNLGH